MSITACRPTVGDEVFLAIVIFHWHGVHLDRSVNLDLHLATILSALREVPCSLVEASKMKVSGGATPVGIL